MLENVTSIGLSCIIGRADVAIPIESVEQIIEYEVASRFPLARPFLGGLGVHEGEVVVSVSLGKRGTATPATYVTKGVLLRGTPGEMRWALEVGQASSFIHARVQPRRESPAQAQLPSWITGATTEDGRSLGWIDVDAMVLDLGGRAVGE